MHSREANARHSFTYIHKLPADPHPHCHVPKESRHMRSGIEPSPRALREPGKFAQREFEPQRIPGKRVRDIASPTPTNFRRILIHIAMCQKKAGTWAGIERTPRALREPGKFAQRGSGFSAFPVSDCGAGLHLHPQTSGGFSSTLPCAKRKQAHEAPAFFWSR